MSSGEQNSAGTLRGDIEERPVIPQCKAVPELLLREVEPMFLERKSSEPGREAFAGQLIHTTGQGAVRSFLESSERGSTSFLGGLGSRCSLTAG